MENNRGYVEKLEEEKKKLKKRIKNMKEQIEYQDAEIRRLREVRGVVEGMSKIYDAAESIFEHFYHQYEDKYED